MYDASNFIEKNRDFVVAEIATITQQSSHKLVQEIFEERVSLSSTILIWKGKCRYSYLYPI